jgi:hypothetical protein
LASSASSTKRFVAVTDGQWHLKALLVKIKAFAHFLAFIKMKNKAAQQLGRLGGLKTSEAKAAASKANGKKGGRPRKTQTSSASGGDAPN